MNKINVFISSPGDVQQERQIAKNVIADLNRIYSQYIKLETIMWEELPLEATATFQEGINYFLDKFPVDIAIFILWSRLGSKLGQSFKKQDGTEYQSGTEYEYELMHTLWRQTKKPKIMVYVKDVEPHFSGNSLKEVQDSLEQKNMLDEFIEENFRDRETGTNYAYLQFDKQQKFEERLRIHLTRLIQDHIGQDVSVREWEGNPYVGLRSYEEEESAIFCGRQSLIYDIAEQWMGNRDADAQRPLLILGESGSGKSSLVKAGVIPYLHKMTTDKRTYNIETITPSEFRGNVYSGIVSMLLSSFPRLKDNPVITDLTQGISPGYDFKYLQYALDNTPSEDISVFFFDQFEELFTDNLISEEEKRKTLQLLLGLCSMKHLWIIISMRNDFYSKFTAYPDFGALKNESLVVDIPNVSATDVAEIVEVPAKKALLNWEINNHGQSLSKKLIEEAVEIKDLPLIEFGLSELYEYRVDEKLTFEAYEKIGRLKGAIAKYADGCYESLTQKEKQEFDQLLGSVITVSSQDGNKYVRKTALIKEVAKTDDQRNLIKKLTDAHLFVTGKDTNSEPTITIVHEMLFSSWDIIKNWIEKQKELLNKRSHYESLAKHWDSNGRRQRDLIQDRSQLLDCEYFMYRNEDNTAGIIHDFLQESLKRNSRRGLAKHIVGLFLSCFLLLSIIMVFSNNNTTGFDNIDKYIDFSKPMYYLLAFIPLVIIAIHAIIIRLIGKPKYKTIKFTFFFTILISIGYIVCIISDIRNPDFSWLALIWYIPLAIAGFSVVKDYHKRQLWAKGIFKPYFINDSADKIIEIIKWGVIGVVILLGLVAVGFIVAFENEEKDEAIEKYEKTLEVADELFEGLNNIQGILSWGDRLYLNNIRLQYLKDRFSDQINDTTPDRREGQVAVCYYNLYNPLKATVYLYPHRWWDHQILSIKSYMKAGAYSLAEVYLELYLMESETESYPKYCVSSYASTHDLIWIAEKLGRFDLAEQLYDLIIANGEDIQSSAAFVMNYGHIQLMKGNLQEALSYYRQSMNVGITSDMDVKVVKKQHDYIKEVIADDFSVFNWLEVGDKEMISHAAERLGITYKTEFYTSSADSVATEQMQDKLVGVWALADSSLVIEYDDIKPLCLYRHFNQNKNEDARGLTNCRYSYKDGKTYLEELDQDKNIHSVCAGEIISVSDTELSIRILDNGNVLDKGKTRTYHKVENK